MMLEIMDILPINSMEYQLRFTTIFKGNVKQRCHQRTKR